MLQKSKKSVLTEHEFVSMVAHDFLSPLHTIRGYIEVLKLTAGEKLSEVEHHPLNEITHISEECYETLETLIALFKNQDTEETKNVNVQDLIQSLQKVLHLDLIDKKIDLICKTDMTHIKTHGGFLKQILINLLKNAIKASPKKSPISLSFQPCNEAFKIIIEDKGPGLNQDFINQNPFIHFDNKNDTPKSTRKIKKGLGLYIIEQCLQTLKGELHVSTSTRGSIFTLTFQTTPS